MWRAAAFVDAVPPIVKRPFAASVRFPSGNPQTATVSAVPSSRSINRAPGGGGSRPKSAGSVAATTTAIASPGIVAASKRRTASARYPAPSTTKVAFAPSTGRRTTAKTGAANAPPRVFTATARPVPRPLSAALCASRVNVAPISSVGAPRMDAATVASATQTAPSPSPRALRSQASSSIACVKACPAARTATPSQSNSRPVGSFAFPAKVAPSAVPPKNTTSTATKVKTVPSSTNASWRVTTTSSPSPRRPVMANVATSRGRDVRSLDLAPTVPRRGRGCDDPDGEARDIAASIAAHARFRPAKRHVAPRNPSAGCAQTTAATTPATAPAVFAA